MIKGLYTSLLFLSLGAAAQDGLQAEIDNGKPYLVHNVASGETLSSISRNFKITVAEIASFNKINADKGLQKNQAIRIPLKADNLTQTDCSSCPKVYYKVMPKEGLYRIGLNFGNTKAETLKKLNNLNTDAVDIGQNLLVGYLSAPAGKMNGEITQKATPSTPTNNSTYQPNETPAVIKKTEVTVPQTTVKNDPPPVINKPKEQPKQTPVVETPKQTPVAETPKQQQATPQQNNSSNLGSGVFANEYAGKQNVSKNGTAAVFKSTSGWGDAKYYVLMNGVAPGTIIKIDNSSTSKSIYAKVLGELPQLKQNENVLLRISNAAASALDGGEENMSVTINY
jgi:LysM repeat protein